MYNFPVDNSINVQQLMTFVNEIYSRQNSAFKLNLAFGYILRHRETMEVRYFRPFDHEGVLDLPYYIARRSDLAGLERKIKNLNLLELLMRQRPDTKWVIELLTNVRITVFKTKFLLGNSDESIPQHIKINRAIYSLTSDKRTGKKFEDNLCAFRCLALHQGHNLKNLEVACQTNFKRWKVARDPKLPFQGLMLEEDMPAFEKCFETNVEVFSLDEDEIAQVVYSSMESIRPHCL